MLSIEWGMWGGHGGLGMGMESLRLRGVKGVEAPQGFQTRFYRCGCPLSFSIQFWRWRCGTGGLVAEVDKVGCRAVVIPRAPRPV
jgi:hypothetical protein